MDFLSVREQEMIGIDKDIVKRTWEEFDGSIKNKKLILFGAGSAINDIFDKYVAEVSYIIDNDEKKWGSNYKGIAIYSPEKLREEISDEVIVLITSAFVKSISEQLKDMGIKNIFSKRLMNWYERRPKETDLEKIEKVKEILFDDESVEVFSKIIEKRNNNEMDYRDLYNEEKPQYFDSDIMYTQDDEVFVEAGAFDGVTIEDFLKWSDNKYKRIYAYEPMKDNFECLQERLKNIKIPEEKLVLKNKAIWKGSEKLFFSNNKAGSAVDSSGELGVDAEALQVNEDDKVTFVKMDIEGSELYALEGMEDIIKKDRPKLAICIYHRYDDLWEIPLYVHNLVSDYKLYIRHYCSIGEETVLYAMPK